MDIKSIHLAVETAVKDLAERDEAGRLIMLAMLAGEHILLLGPPGTAKSMLARRICKTFNNFKYFEYLLTRFTVPEELFGPLSLTALQQDRFHRMTEGYLPDANVAFLDEIFKANSSILNTLLTLINERVFHNGRDRVVTGLRTIVGASNEVPAEGDGLEALYDRFLIRYVVQPVESNEEFLKKIINDMPLEANQVISQETIREIDNNMMDVRLSEDVQMGILHLRAKLKTKDIYVSDRRWKKAVKVLKVAAMVSGRDEVDRFDALLLSHMLWSLPEQRADVESLVRGVFLGTAEDDDRPQQLASLSAKLVDLRDEISGAKAGRRATCPNDRICTNFVENRDVLGGCRNFIPDNQGGCLRFVANSGTQRQWFAPARSQAMYSFGGSTGAQHPQRWRCTTEPCKRFHELVQEITALKQGLNNDLNTLTKAVADKGTERIHFFTMNVGIEDTESRMYTLKTALSSAQALLDKARIINGQLFGGDEE